MNQNNLFFIIFFSFKFENEKKIKLDINRIVLCFFPKSYIGFTILNSTQVLSHLLPRN